MLSWIITPTGKTIREKSNLCRDYDSNRSGAISKEKLKEVCRKMGVKGSEEEIDNIIARCVNYSRYCEIDCSCCDLNSSCDVKGDGRIDYHEFAVNLTQVCPPTTRKAATSITAQDFMHPNQQRSVNAILQIHNKHTVGRPKLEIDTSVVFFIN